MARCWRQRAADQTVRLWSLSNLTAEPRVLRGHDGSGLRAWRSVLMARCWRQRAADQTVRLWSLSNLTAEPRVLRGHDDTVYGVAFQS